MGIIPIFLRTFAAETREDPFEGNVVDKAPTLSMSFPFSIGCCSSTGGTFTYYISAGDNRVYAGGN